MGKQRKLHSSDAGYVAERLNPGIPGQKVVIYRAAEQGIDVGMDKYAIVCDAHNSIVGVNSIASARAAMKNPDSFCEECRDFTVCEH